MTNEMSELERRCVDVLTSEPFCYTEGRGFDALAIVRAVLAEAGVAELVHACELALNFILYRQGNDAGETVTVSDLRSALANCRSNTCATPAQPYRRTDND